MKVREMIGDLSGLNWTCSYSGSQRLLPNPKTAKIVKVEQISDAIRLLSKDNSNEYSVVVSLPDKLVLDRLFKTLNDSTVKTFSEINEL